MTMLQQIQDSDNVYYFQCLSIYILSVFTEKPYSKLLECNVVYFPIITSSHTMSK